MNKLSLAEWDVLVAPILHRIEAAAKTCENRASHIAWEVNYLQTRPEFLTRAISALTDAEITLEKALQHIKRAKSIYDKLPVEEEDDETSHRD